MNDAGFGGLGGGSTIASRVAVTDSGNKYTASDVEGVLAEIATTSTTSAARVTVADTGNHYAATDVEAALAEIATTSTTPASRVTVVDSGNHYAATDVEAALAEIATTDAAVTATANAAAADVTAWKGDNRTFFSNYIGSKFGATRFAFAFDDFVDAVIGARWQTNGPPVLNNSFGGGGVLFTNDGDLLYKATNNWLVTPRTKKWALGGRLRFGSVSGLVGGEQRGFAFQVDPSNNMFCGLSADQSLTKFVFKTVVGGVTKFALSTINLDASAFHDVIMYWTTVGLFGSVDGETPVLVTSTATDMYSAAMFERHGLSSPQSTMFVDCVFAAVQSG